MANPQDKFTALANALAKKAKRSKPATKSAPTPVRPADTGDTAGVHVRLESTETAHLTNVLMGALLNAGFRTGHNNVSKANVMRFALYRWSSVTPNDAKEISLLCEKWAANPNREWETAVTVRLGMAEDKHLGMSEDEHLAQLTGQLIKKGLRTGHNGVNNANVLRFAIYRWKQVTEQDAKQFRDICEMWKEASAARRATT